MHITLAGCGLQRNIEMHLFVGQVGINSALAMLCLFFHPKILTLMRRTFTIAFFCWGLAACGRTDRPAVKPGDPLPPAETPKVLEDRSSSFAEVKKSRGDEDLVESLYLELVKNDPRLAELESRLDQLSDEQRDSTKSFYNYEQKSNDYYSSARQHVGTIKDSALRKKMEQMIAVSDTAYRELTANHRTLLAAIDEKALTIEALHEVLKLTRTAAVIGKYQKGHLPGTGALQRLLREYERVAQRIEDATKN
jgi:hypothetical protein